MANLRFYIDPETDEPHIYLHNVTEQEVSEVLIRPLEDRSGYNDSRVAKGQTRSGRYLKVIYVPDPTADSLFVITAYDMSEKEKRALRRRMRKRL
jgi:hypothetical protein